MFDLYIILSYRNDFDIVWPLRIIALESRSSLLVDSELENLKKKKKKVFFLRIQMNRQP